MLHGRIHIITEWRVLPFQVQGVHEYCIILTHCIFFLITKKKRERMLLLNIPKAGAPTFFWEFCESTQPFCTWTNGQQTCCSGLDHFPGGLMPLSPLLLPLFAPQRKTIFNNLLHLLPISQFIVQKSISCLPVFSFLWTPEAAVTLFNHLCLTVPFFSKVPTTFLSHVCFPLHLPS